jgi:asparagine synthase (glutamine-hydrolysing)
MLHCQGVIDFAKLGVPPERLPALGTDGDLTTVTLPGVDLRWNPSFADVALANGKLALAWGRARGAGESSPRGEAARWLERYARDGDRAAEKVGGGFAALILDFGERKALLLVDRFSIETACYRWTAGRLGFSDSAVDVPDATREIDPQSVYDYLYFHVIPAPQTIFRDLRRVEPAHRVTASEARCDTASYWRPVFVENDDRDLHGRFKQFVEIVQQCVEEEADDPSTACFLSGGTDSSTIAGMLTRLRGKPVSAYSIGFKAEGYDEMGYARTAARHFGLEHREYYLTPDDLVTTIPKVAASYDQPFGNSSVLPAYYCALKARQDGFTRMLAGDGGDELFAGNSRYAMQKVFQMYHTLPAGLRQAVLEPAATQWSLFRRVPGFKQIGGYVRHSRVAMPDRLDTFNLLNRLGEDLLFEPDFLASVDRQRPQEQQRATWNDCNAMSLVNRMLAFDWKYALADSDLPKVRGATQLAGVSVGYPFMGRALTDFSLSIPPGWKLKRLKLRWFFKEALRGFLPDEILRKKKHGFGLPFGPWTLRHAALRDMAHESLEGVASRGIVRPAFTRELLGKRLAEAPSYYGEMVWILMLLEQWLRAHEVKSRSQAP